MGAPPTPLQLSLAYSARPAGRSLCLTGGRALPGAATFFGILIFFGPLISSVSGGSDPVVAGSGYGSCSMADTRRELAQLTSTSKGNVGACVDGSRMGPDGDCLSGVDKIQVFPFALQFNEAEKFCVDMGGHLASIHDRAEYNALTAATQVSGVTNSVLIGGYEDDLPGGGKGQWQWTDGSNMDMRFMNSLRPGTVVATGLPVMPYDNYNQDEDEMAYCGAECCAAPGRDRWGFKCCTEGAGQDVEWKTDPSIISPENPEGRYDYTLNNPSCRCCEGMHDWGRRDNGVVTEHFACRFAVNSAGQDGAPSCSPSAMVKELASLKQDGNIGAVTGNGDTITTFPLALRFDDAERFCTDFGGHLASIHNDADYAALTQATKMSGVTDAVFVGGYEEHVDQRWLWTDGSPMDMDFITAHAWGFDNYQENNEDEIAFCGEGCYTSRGWGPGGQGCECSPLPWRLLSFETSNKHLRSPRLGPAGRRRHQPGVRLPLLGFWRARTVLVPRLFRLRGETMRSQLRPAHGGLAHIQRLEQPCRWSHDGQRRSSPGVPLRPQMGPRRTILPGCGRASGLDPRPE